MSFLFSDKPKKDEKYGDLFMGRDFGTPVQPGVAPIVYQPPDQQTQQPQQSQGLLSSLAQGFTQPITNLTRGGTAMLSQGAQTQDFQDTVRSLNETIARADKKIKDISITEAERRRWQNLRRQTIQQRDGLAEGRIDTQNTQIQELDPVKAAASVAEIGLYALGPAASRAAGLTRAGTFTAAKGAAPAIRSGRLAGRGATQTAGRMRDMSRGQLGRAAGVTGAEGATYGATGYMSRADDPTASGLLQSMAGGAVLGGAIPVVGAGLGRGLPAANRGVSNSFSKASEVFNETSVGAKTKEIALNVQQKLQRSEIKILNPIRQAENRGLLPKNTALRVETLIRDVKTARVQADNFAQNNASWQRAIRGADGKAITKQELSDLNRYVEARAELNNIAANPRLGAKGRKAQFQKTIQELDNFDRKERYDALVNYNRELTDMLLEEGIVTPREVASWRSSNTEYLRMQRVIDDLSQTGRRGTGGGVSIRTSITDLKKKGSTRQALNMVETQMDRTEKVFQEVLRNRASKEMIDALEKLGLADPARIAENVLVRQGLQESLGLSRPLKQAYERFVKSQSKYVRRIQSEINQLQSQARGELKKEIRKATKGAVVKPTDTGEMPVENIAAVIDQILSADNKTLRALNRKFLNREPKLAKAIQELQDMQETLSGINAKRKLEYQEILKRADDKVAGKPTISRIVNGIDEVYTTLPEIEAAAKGWNREVITGVGRLLATPVRVLRTTLTGALNPAFIPKSLVRDGIESFNLSPNAIATHSPANILGALADAAGKDDLFKRYMATEAGNTFTDFLRKPRQAASEIRKQSRLQLPPVQKAKEVIKTPSQWYRTVEDVSRWQEILGRYQQFRGAYNDAIKKGMSKQDAEMFARFNARNNQVDFFQTGDWSAVLNSFYPYFNSSVQGGGRIARSLKERPVTTSAKLIVSVQVPTALNAMYNLSDPRRAEIYFDIPEYEHDNNWVWVLPGTEKTDGRWNVVKIPKPPGVGNFSNPVRQMTESLYGYDPVNFGEMVSQLVRGMGSPVDVSSRSAAIGSAIPQIMKPAVQATTNYDFFTGREIVPSWLKENEPEAFNQRFDNTSATASQIGKWIGVSPLTVEKFLQDTSGEFGRNALFYLDTGANLAGVEGGTGGRSNVESLRRAFSSAAGGQENRAFRNKLDTTISSKSSLSKEITKAIKDNNTSEANRLAKEYNDKVKGLVDTFNSRGDEFVKLSDGQRGLLESLMFPMDGNSLSKRSIESRKKQ